MLFGPLPDSGDYYNLQYLDEKESKVICDEKVQIFISNEKHARLLNSDCFDCQDIIFLSPDSIKIQDLVFDRKK